MEGLPFGVVEEEDVETGHVIADKGNEAQTVARDVRRPRRSGCRSGRSGYHFQSFHVGDLDQVADWFR